MSNGGMQQTEKATAAFVLSLLAGLWMLSAAGMMGMMGGYGFGGMMGGQGGQYGPSGMNHSQGRGGWMWSSGMHGFGATWLWLGVAAGIVVLIGAVMLYVKPQERRGWGLAILIISAVDFFVGMGGLLAGILGVIGGALAMAGKP